MSDGDESRAAGEEPSAPDGITAEAAVRAFLIADVRGYTRFTQEHGDEEAGRLAAAFASLAREAVSSCDGELLELRGDEALCVFASARQALRAAVELQTRFRLPSADGSTFPLPIGIGLDAGEAVPIEGGYRGGALNTAARLCSLAGPGEILATDTLISLARRVEGLRFVDRKPVRVKGLEKPVRVIEVVPEVALPPLPQVAAQPRAQTAKRRLIVAGIAVVSAVAVFAVLRASGNDYLPRLDANAIGVIDADAAGIAHQLTTGSTPGAIAAGGGFVWVASEEDGTLSRVDPATRAVQTLRVGESASGVAFGGAGGGSVWVANGNERSVAQVNPRSLRVVQTFGVGNRPGPVAVDGQAVWVANTIDATVSRIDLQRGAVTTVPVGGTPAGIAAGAGAVWVADEASGVVLRLDPRSGRVVQAVNVGNAPTGVAVGEGGVWVANRQDGTVSRVDPETNSVSSTIRVGPNPTAVAAGAGAVWVANSGNGTLARIDPRAGRVEKTASLKSSPHTLALADGRVWATTRPAVGSHRGGVLRVESIPFTCRCVDPVAADVPEYTLLPLVYDSLVAYRRVSGTAGGALVGGLAAKVPVPTDAGRTYAFQLRRGIRYANGAPVRASDFRYTMERAFAMGIPPIYGGIVGARACLEKKGRCDLAEGIEVDDAAGTITVRLAEPDPDFLHKLTLSFAFVVPTGTPRRLAPGRPIPGTGPYRIASFDPERELRLVRNPHFRVWSRDARPDGYANEIRVRLSKDLAGSIKAVEKGEADWVSEAYKLPDSQLRGLLTRYPGRLHTDAEMSTAFLFLNAGVPPFDDVRVRRALNYAIDRDELVEAAGTPAAARTSCQILPAGFPGYRPYCPYTQNPRSAGTWTAPDVARARSLIASSGTRGMRVVVHGFKERISELRYVVSLLRQLGYKSSLRLRTRFKGYFGYVGDSRNRAQIGMLGWSAGYAAPFEFLQLFSCTTLVRNDPANINLSQFCDRTIERRMNRAASVQTTDPVRANALWADVDRALVDEAAAVPFVNARAVAFVSERVGNYQFHPLYYGLLEQVWVK